MAAGPFIIKDGVIVLYPQLGVPSGLRKGALYIDDADGILVNYDGSASRKVVNVSSTQTLTNKTLTAPVVNSPTGITKSDVGLSNVDNYSAAQLAALTESLTNKTIDGDLNTVQDLPITALKTNMSYANKILSFDASGIPIATVTGPDGDYVSTDGVQTLNDKTLNDTSFTGTVTGLDSSDVGLGNVNNTSDATKNAAAVTLTNKTIESGTFTNHLDIVEYGTVTTPSSQAVRLYAKTNGRLYSKDDAGTDYIVSGCVVQTVNTQTSALFTTSTVMPHDDTIPQNTEGAEIITRSITPTSSTNKLKITMNLFASNSTAGAAISMALFQDTTANAVAATSSLASGTGATECISLTYFMTAGTTSSTTFKMRVGPSSGTVSVNGTSGVRLFGGVASTSITIEEIQV